MQSDFKETLSVVGGLLTEYHLDIDVLKTLCQDAVSSNQAILDTTSGVIPECEAYNLKMKIHMAENILIFLRCLTAHRQFPPHL